MRPDDPKPLALLIDMVGFGTRPLIQSQVTPWLKENEIVMLGRASEFRDPVIAQLHERSHISDDVQAFIPDIFLYVIDGASLTEDSDHSHLIRAIKELKGLPPIVVITKVESFSAEEYNLRVEWISSVTSISPDSIYRVHTGNGNQRFLATPKNKVEGWRILKACFKQYALAITPLRHQQQSRTIRQTIIRHRCKRWSRRCTTIREGICSNNCGSLCLGMFCWMMILISVMMSMFYTLRVRP